MKRVARVRYVTTDRAAGTMKDPAARRASFETAGAGERPAFYVKQVHGMEIVAVKNPKPVEASPEADGLVTNLAEIILCVFVADCLPLFLWEKTGKAAGVFHAGWRGVAAGMPRRAVESFRLNFGIEPQDLHFSIGPHIRDCCFRVGPETSGRFDTRSVFMRGDSTFVDLNKETRHQLEEAGLKDAWAQAGTRQCTSCGGDRFFSYRRDKTDARMMAFITLEP